MTISTVGVHAIVLALLLLALGALTGQYVLGVGARILVLVGASAGFILLAKRPYLRRYEARWAGALALWVAAVGVSAPFAVNIREGLLDVGRQVFMALAAFGVILLLRDSPARRALAVGMVLLSGLVSACIVVLWVAHNGWSFPRSAAEIQAFKGALVVDRGIHLNPLAFCATTAFMLGYPVLKARWHRVWAVALWLVGLAFSGSRGVLLSVLLSGLLTILMRRWIMLHSVYRLALVALFLSGMALLGLVELDTSITSVQAIDGASLLRELSDFSRGRLELWIAAIRKFAERPLLGWGVGSWNVDLGLYLPEYGRRREVLERLGSGAFHSAYLTALAERGLLGFGAGLLIVAVIGTQVRVSENRKVASADSNTELTSNALLWFLFILVRGFVEVGGIWGYANSLADFLVFFGASYIIASSHLLMRGRTGAEGA